MAREQHKDDDNRNNNNNIKNNNVVLPWKNQNGWEQIKAKQIKAKHLTVWMGEWIEVTELISISKISIPIWIYWRGRKENWMNQLKWRWRRLISHRNGNAQFYSIENKKEEKRIKSYIEVRELIESHF